MVTATAMATAERAQTMHSVLPYGQGKPEHGIDATREESLEADMYFLKPDELWKIEKPYGMRFYAEGVPQSNVRRERHRVVLNDIRQLEKMPSVDVQEMEE